MIFIFYQLAQTENRQASVFRHVTALKSVASLALRADNERGGSNVSLSQRKNKFS